MTYHLRDDLSFCKLGERYIFLDVAADRYFALKADDNALLGSLIENDTEKVSLPALAPLAALLTSDEGGTPLAPAQIRSTTQSIIEQPGRPVRGQYPLMLLALAKAHRDIRCKPLSRLLCHDFPPAPSTTRDRNRLAQIATTFDSVTRIFGREGNCLPRSLALWRVLRRHRHKAQIVLGVKDLPFAAHCWVQSDDLLLNDRLETIQPFTPVLVR